MYHSELYKIRILYSILLSKVKDISIAIANDKKEYIYIYLGEEDPLAVTAVINKLAANTR
jgi:hypothetical protein